jgi:hypothetical protein
MASQSRRRNRSDREKEIVRIEHVFGQLLNECDPMVQFMAESNAYNTTVHPQLSREIDRLLEQVRSSSPSSISHSVQIERFADKVWAKHANHLRTDLVQLAANWNGRKSTPLDVQAQCRFVAHLELMAACCRHIADQRRRHVQ